MKPGAAEGRNAGEGKKSKGKKIVVCESGVQILEHPFFAPGFFA
jgi:hypothetical protein